MSLSVLLVNPPYSSFQFVTRNELLPQEPLGILFIAGFLSARGVHVEVVDFMNNSMDKLYDYYWQGASEPEIEAEFRRRSPDIVGISSMFSVHCHAVHRVAAAAKRAVPDVLVVVGGAHASALPQIISSDKNIDLVVIGEGEQTLHEIIIKHTDGESPHEIAGIAYTDESGVYHVTERRNFLNLRDHPGPAYDMLDIERYIATSYSRKHTMHPRRAAVITSRGCPCNCIFCSVKSVWRHSYHTRDVKSVLDEIEWLIAEHGIGEIEFWDDNLAINRHHFNAVLDGIIERRLPIHWWSPGGIAVWMFDERLIDKCRKSGCYKLNFSIETGSLKTQKFIRKSQIDLNRTKQIIKYCNSVGIWTRSAFMIGFPFEKREDIMETIDYSIDCSVDTATFRIAVPYPGSDMYQIWKENKLLPDDVECKEPDRWIGTIYRACGRTCYLSRDEVQSLYELAQKTFWAHRRRRFLNPLYLAKKMRSWDHIKYAARLFPLWVRLSLLRQ